MLFSAASTTQECSCCLDVSNQGFYLSEEECDFPQYRASKLTSPQVASVAQSNIYIASKFFACISQSNTLGLWIKDSSACDHISSSKSLLSNIYLFTVSTYCYFSQWDPNKSKRYWTS